MGNYAFSSGVEMTEENMYHVFDTSDTTPIFSGNYESKNSNFYTHKLEVIKNSIKYNLNLAISTYTNTMNNSYQFSLPVLTDEEWDKILNNISIVSFMQGWDCGLDIYNNYQVVSSTNNELAVTQDDIYYTEKDGFNNTVSYYHKIDCPHWNPTGDIISFKSKDVKYDKVNDKYDHKNLACYTCINTGNYSENSKFSDANEPNYYTKIENSTSLSNNQKLAAYIGLAYARQNTYKTNALPVSEGYKVVKNTVSNVTNNYSDTIPESLNNITKIYITISNVNPLSPTTDTMGNFNCVINGVNIGAISIPLRQSKERTIELNVANISGTGNTTITLNKTATTAVNVSYAVNGIKIIYK